MSSSQDNISCTIENNKKGVQKLLSEYQGLTFQDKLEKFNDELDSLIIDIKGENIDLILDYTSFLFIQNGIFLGHDEKIEIMNKLSKLYHKLKNLYFFNMLIFLYKKIEKIIKNIDDSYDKHYVKFDIKNDIILSSIYDYENNINNEYKSLSINLKSTNSQKFRYLCNYLEDIDNKEDIYRNYILLRGDFEEGCILKVKFNDNYLILNDNNLNKLKELLKIYGIENNEWEKYERRKPINLLNEEEKKSKKDLNNKIEEENKNSREKLSNALIMQENFIKNNFKNTKKNTKVFKNIFSRLQEIILSDEKTKNSIIKIIPYGSVTQCTCNETSDLEMTILTKNFEKYNEKLILSLFQSIIDNIENNYFSEFNQYLEGIRYTKRTILLLLIHKESKTKIEINCNNFFSVMNSTLIRNYLTYDARALILINTIKDWSKQKEINSNSNFFPSANEKSNFTHIFFSK